MCSTFCHFRKRMGGRKQWDELEPDYTRPPLLVRPLKAFIHPGTCLYVEGEAGSRYYRIVREGSTEGSFLGNQLLPIHESPLSPLQIPGDKGALSSTILEVVQTTALETVSFASLT